MSIESVMPSYHLISVAPSPVLNLSQPQGFFLVSWLFTSGDQSIRASASASVLPMNIQDWFPLRLTSLISLLPKGLKSVLQHHSLKASILEVCGIPPGVSGDPLAYLLAVPCHNMALAYSVTLGAPLQQPWTKRSMKKLLG